MPVIDASIELLESLLNRYLSLDRSFFTQVSSLQGKVFQFQLTDLQFTFYLVPSARRISILQHYEGTADCCIKGTLLSLVQLSHQSTTHAGTIGDIDISGDASLAHRLGSISAAINIDWEELLSQWMGDIPAHQLGQGWRNLSAWIRESSNTLVLDVGEYLQEEVSLTPSQEELNDHYLGVEQFRDDVERLEARLVRLGRSIAKTNP